VYPLAAPKAVLLFLLRLFKSAQRIGGNGGRTMAAATMTANTKRRRQCLAPRVVQT
jgi:hypothetical protein